MTGYLLTVYIENETFVTPVMYYLKIFFNIRNGYVFSISDVLHKKGNRLKMWNVVPPPHTHTLLFNITENNLYFSISERK